MIFLLPSWHTSRSTGISPKLSLKNSETNQEIKEMLSRIRNQKLSLKELIKISFSVFGWTSKQNLNRVMRRFISNNSQQEFQEQTLHLILLLDASGLVLILFQALKMLKSLMSCALVVSLTQECSIIQQFQFQVSNGWLDQLLPFKIAWYVSIIQILKHLWPTQSSVKCTCQTTFLRLKMTILKLVSGMMKTRYGLLILSKILHGIRPKDFLVLPLESSLQLLIFKRKL